jgi:hypothetical protein
MISIQVIPDRTTNNDNLKKLVDAFSQMYQPPINRITKKGLSPKNYLAWEIYIKSDNIEFVLSVPDEWEKFALNQLSVCYPKATLKRFTLALEERTENSGMIARLKNHYFLSLSTDRRPLDPLPAILETSKTLVPGELCLIQIVLDPAEPDWYTGAVDAYNRFSRGEMPKRLEVDPLQIATKAADLTAKAGLELINMVVEIITEKESEPEKTEEPARVSLLRDGRLTNDTLQKQRFNAFDTTIRVLVQSPNKEKRRQVLQGISAAFKSISDDNELRSSGVNNLLAFLKDIQGKKLPFFKVNNDFLSVPEVARLLQLPPRSLQEIYPIQSIQVRELEIPSEMTASKGIPLGNTTVKGKDYPVKWSIANYDELCLPHVVVGGMGTGKSLGFGAGFAVDCYREGFGTFVIDVSDGDMSNEIRDSLPEGAKVIDLDFGNTENPIPLNWSEVARAARSREIANILSAQLVSYLAKFATEPGDRTERYLKAAGRTVFENVPEATILDIILFLCSKPYRAEVMPKVTDPRSIDLWSDFDSMSEGLRMQIIQPVLNRLDSITGNEYLLNCLFQKPNPAINFRKWADEGYCVILRVPKSILWDDCTDAMATYLIAKVWMAILTRIDQPTNCRKPAFLIMDEPSQFLGSAKGGIRSTWGSMIVESRKWRLGLVFMFHDFGQIPSELRNLLKAAGPHYTLYSSSKETFKALEEEIKPFEIDECLEIKTHHALNVVRCNNQYYKFMAQMAPPPGKRYPKTDRKGLTKECSGRFGKPVELVEQEIYSKEKFLLKSN